MKNVFQTCLILLIPLLASVDGCLDFEGIDFRISVFANPLVDPANGIMPDELIGSFIESDNSFFLHVGSAGEGFPAGCLRLVSVSVPTDSKEAISYSSIVMFVEKVGEHLVAHLPLKNGDLIEDQESWQENEIEGYLLWKLKISENSLKVVMASPDMLDRLVKSEKLTLDTNDNNVKLITNSSESIKKLIETYSDKMFDEELMTFTRAGIVKTTR